MTALTRKGFLTTAAAAALGLSATAFASEATQTVPEGMDPLEMLLAKDAIRDQIYRYCVSMDRWDLEVGYDIFTEDSVLDYGADVYQGDGKGFVDMCCLLAHPNLYMTAHRMVNVLIAFDSPTEAHSQTYGHCNMILPPAEDGVSTQKLGADCRYLDRWVKCDDGVWRIRERLAVTDWNTQEAVTLTKPAADYRGDKDTEPLYSFFPEYC